VNGASKPAGRILHEHSCNIRARGQSPERQEQAAASIGLYYELMESWAASPAANAAAEAARAPWDGCYARLPKRVTALHSVTVLSGKRCGSFGWGTADDADNADEICGGGPEELRIDTNVREGG
jgi:hypothetical protein